MWVVHGVIYLFIKFENQVININDQNIIFDKENMSLYLRGLKYQVKQCEPFMFKKFSISYIVV